MIIFIELLLIFRALFPKILYDRLIIDAEMQVVLSRDLGSELQRFDEETRK